MGTRPEAIKLAPLIGLAQRKRGFQVRVVNTGQHRDLVPQILAFFSVRPSVNLAVMKNRQSLTDISVGVLRKMEGLLKTEKPDWVVVQGDTSTAFLASLASFYARIPVAHVEAGLRTGNIHAPWPEEMNRNLISRIASLHFSPTFTASRNLRRENIDQARIHITGNTGIDALKILVRKLHRNPGLRKRAVRECFRAGVPTWLATGVAPLVLITLHRRENQGAGIQRFGRALIRLAKEFPTHAFVCPLHPNPAVGPVLRQITQPARRKNLFLVKPLGYLPFVQLMSRATLILSDSGGVQEEAPSLGKRVVVLREVTERQEGLGTAYMRLAGCHIAKILGFSRAALRGRWRVPRGGTDFYGDGRASQRILSALLQSRIRG